LAAVKCPESGGPHTTNKAGRAEEEAQDQDENIVE